MYRNSGFKKKKKSYQWEFEFYLGFLPANLCMPPQFPTDGCYWRRQHCSQLNMNTESSFENHLSILFNLRVYHTLFASFIVPYFNFFSKEVSWLVPQGELPMGLHSGARGPVSGTSLDSPQVAEAPRSPSHGVTHADQWLAGSTWLFWLSCSCSCGMCQPVRHTPV